MNPYDRTEKIDNYLENNMSNEEKKDFNAMLLNSKDMPKIQIITDVTDLSTNILSAGLKL